jgi:hypothetical protein
LQPNVMMVRGHLHANNKKEEEEESGRGASLL